jgi:pimeloyl-ACP methyl ester carboxylesterase
VRIEADRGRLDTTRILKYVRWLRWQPASEEELANITVPTLIVAPAFARLSTARKLKALIKCSQLAIIPGNGIFALLEDPDAFMWAVGPFLRASARGRPPAVRLAGEEGLTVLSGGMRTDVVEKRSDEAVVFLHGWLMSPQMWAHAMNALQDQTRCVALWQPGHGHSTAPHYEFSMEEWSDRLIETLDNLNIKKAVLVGHSMGGMLSLQTVRKYPERVKGLVLVDTQDDLWDKPRNDYWMERVNALAVSWGPEAARQTAQLLMSEHFLDTNAGWLGEWTNEVAKYDLDGQRYLGRAIAERADLSTRNQDIKVPVLIVHGTADQAIAVDVARAMRERIPGAVLEEIAGAGHCPPLENPDRFTEILVHFLESKQMIKGKSK